MSFKIEGSLQSLFDRAIAHFIEQGRPALTPAGMCMYRIVIDGKMCKCAFGVFIPDENYRPGMEEKTVTTLTRDGDVLFQSNAHLDLMQRLQDAHDTGWTNRHRPIEEFAYQLVYIADTVPLVFDKQQFIEHLTRRADRTLIEVDG